MELIVNQDVIDVLKQKYTDKADSIAECERSQAQSVASMEKLDNLI